MNNEKQRIAIAEACGWKNVKLTNHEEVDIDSRSTIYWSGFTGLPPEFRHHLNRVRVPDYLTDLNAMHDAEKGMSDDNAEKFRAWLLQVNGYNHDRVVSCTAAQRAKAFLKTIGKWKE